MGFDEEDYETFNVSFTFSKKDGSLVDFRNINDDFVDTGKASISLEELANQKIKHFTMHKILFGWGSPGCVYVKVGDTYKKVCTK